MNGNIALSLEIGSAYAIQVALLQIPALVVFSAIWGYYYPYAIEKTLFNHPHQSEMLNAKPSYPSPFFSFNARPLPQFDGFTLVFPQWDFYAVIFSVFLLTYVYLEGKSNYFKGAILLLCYFILIAAFFVAPV
jgi:Ca2+:H+ antiporter